MKAPMKANELPAYMAEKKREGASGSGEDPIARDHRRRMMSAFWPQLVDYAVNTAPSADALRQKLQMLLWEADSCGFVPPAERTREGAVPAFGLDAIELAQRLQIGGALYRRPDGPELGCRLPLDEARALAAERPDLVCVDGHDMARGLCQCGAWH